LNPQEISLNRQDALVLPTFGKTFVNPKPSAIIAASHGQSGMTFPKSRFFRHKHGWRQAYIDVGQGAPVVCVHGNPSWSFYFHRIIREFAATHRVIVPDHIGMGRSDAPRPGQYDFHFEQRVDDLDALLGELLSDELPDQKITLVVHDWGGIIGLRYALRHPERIGRLVVLNTAAFPLLKGKQLPWQIALVRNSKIGAWACTQWNAFALGAAWFGVVRPQNPELRKALLEPYKDADRRRTILEFVRDIPLHALDRGYSELVQTEQQLKRLKDKPMLLLWGLRDFVFDADYYHEFARRFPDARKVPLSDAGHYVLFDQPERCTQEIRDFIAQTSPA